jgi:hypothetical protein
MDPVSKNSNRRDILVDEEFLFLMKNCMFKLCNYKTLDLVPKLVALKSSRPLRPIAAFPQGELGGAHTS